ncbi:MAG: hypothetical protein QM639_18330 [Rhodocyclaceae bacterium]
MDARAVPQEGNRTHAGQRKAVYARGEDGRIVAVASQGWEVEEIVTTQAVDALRAQADAARIRARAGHSAPLEYWMYAKRMDVALLAQATGLWRWRVRRHLRPAVFARLPARILQRYAQALGLTPDTLCQVP